MSAIDSSLSDSDEGGATKGAAEGAFSPLVGSFGMSGGNPNLSLLMPQPAPESRSSPVTVAEDDDLYEEDFVDEAELSAFRVRVSRHSSANRLSGRVSSGQSQSRSQTRGYFDSPSGSASRRRRDAGDGGGMMSRNGSGVQSPISSHIQSTSPYVFSLIYPLTSGFSSV